MSLDHAIRPTEPSPNPDDAPTTFFTRVPVLHDDPSPRAPWPLLAAVVVALLVVGGALLVVLGPHW